MSEELITPGESSRGSSASPATGDVPQEQRAQATLMWILTIFASFIPGLIFYLVSNEKPYVKRQAALALTGSIVWIVGMIASVILMVVLVGFLTYFAVAVWALVACILGAVATSKGQDYRPWLIDGIGAKLFKV